jgi:hypothetical protein
VFLGSDVRSLPTRCRTLSDEGCFVETMRAVARCHIAVRALSNDALDDIYRLLHALHEAMIEVVDDVVSSPRKRDSAAVPALGGLLHVLVLVQIAHRAAACRTASATVQVHRCVSSSLQFLR